VYVYVYAYVVDINIYVLCTELHVIGPLFAYSNAEPLPGKEQAHKESWSKILLMHENNSLDDLASLCVSEETSVTVRYMHSY
jgi:hypothetical protein